MKFAPIVLCFFICAAGWSPLCCQPDSLWLRTYDLGAQAKTTSMLATRGGGFALCGYSLDAARGDSATGWILQLAETGDSLWYSELPEFARVNDIGQFPANRDFCVSGRSQSYSALVARCAVRGAVVWSRELGSQAEFAAHCLTADSGVACCGYRWLDSGSRQDMLVAKYSGDGLPRWQWTSNETGWDQAQAIAALPGGDFVVSGYTVRTPNTAWIVRMSPNGSNRPPLEIAPAANAFIRGPYVAPSGMSDVVVATVQTEADQSADFALSGFTSRDEALWQVQESIPGARLELRSLLPMVNGGFFMCGMISDTTRGIFLAERHNALPPRWEVRLHAAALDVAAADVVSDGEFVIAGTQYLNGRRLVFVLRLGAPQIAPVAQLTLYRPAAVAADLRLCWQAHPAALSYNIYRGMTAKLVAGPDTWIGNTTSTAFIDRNILHQPNNSLFYVVTAVMASAPAEPATQNLQAIK